MSVRAYALEEIEKLFADILGLRPAFQLIPDEERLQMALRSALVANRAALAMTYGEETVIPCFELPAGFNPGADPGAVFAEVGLLLYNCISNGGRDDFLPGRDKAVLNAVREAIAREFVENRKEVKA
jgi:hypothetical protein